MSQMKITVSAKADAMIAALQKEIFNRRRKKITAEGVVESLVESGAKSQSDKRFAASWKNLIKDIEKAAKQSEVHGNKPANVSAEEWALIISHRTRKGTTPKKAAAKKTTAKKAAAKKPAAKKPAAKAAPKAAAKPAAGRPARRARKARKAPAAAAA
jgi:topoisomerase IA-like protein